MRINKLLSNYGYCSRKEANRLISDNRVIVNGKICVPGQWVEESDEILLDKEKIKRKERVYIALNKPVGITCTAAEDVKNNIINFLNYNKYIFPIGRLDKESQGLILLTNDGDLANKILESENEHEKEYLVTLDREYEDEFLKAMSLGVDIGGTITRRCKVYRVNNNTFRIILTQGLNRQIRKMSRALGYNVIKLERIRILNIELKGIEYGCWRELRDSEINKLKFI